MAGSSGDSREFATRLTKIEVRQDNVERNLTERSKQTAAAIDQLREEVDDRLEQVVHAQVQGDKLLERDLEKVAAQVTRSNELLTKINTKLAVHAFIFGSIGVMGMALFTAYSKSSFDALHESRMDIQKSQFQIQELRRDVIENAADNAAVNTRQDDERK